MPESAKETVTFGYASSANVTFRGEIESGYTREEWDEMSEEDRDTAMNEIVWELVEMWVKE